MKYPKGRIKEIPFSENLIEFDEDQLVDVREKGISIDIRNNLSFEGKAFFLSSFYDWTVILDGKENLCLVPTKKKREE